MSTAEARKLKVVLDTNVYISAFIQPKGLNAQIWRAAISGRYELLVSPAIMTEIAGVLRKKFGWDELHLVQRIKLLAKVAEVLKPAIAIRAIPDDEADNRILECAVAGNADLIVSGDHHLNRLKQFQHIAIIRPADFHR